jgi:HEAT repeat protein
VLRAGAALVLALPAVACGTSAPRPVNPEFDLHDPSGTRRSQAVAKVAATHETRHVPALISRLDDEDDSVRLLAGRTLKDLTGHDTGYRATMESPERRRHIDLWRAWWAAKTRGAAGAPPAGAPPVVRPVPPAPAPAGPGPSGDGPPSPTGAVRSPGS